MKNLCAFTISFLLLKFSFILCSLTDPSCFWRIQNNEDNDGDFRRDCGFVLLIHDEPIDEISNSYLIDFRIPERRYEFFLVMFFATDEINRNPYLLPNMSLIFSLITGMCEDTFGFLEKEYSPQNNSWHLINYYCGIQTSCDVELTGPLWTTSSKLTINSRIPKVFFGPFNPNLSDHDQFPYVYQVATKDTCLLHAMASLMLHFRWTWIGLVISDDDQGIQFLSDLREEMKRHGICLAFVNMIPGTMQIYMTRAKIYDKQIMASSAKVVMIYGEMNSTLEVSFRRWAYLGAQRIWITTSQWDVITNKKDFSLDFFHGTVTFAHHNNDIAKFSNFVQIINTSIYPIDISQTMQKWNYFNCSIFKNSNSKMDHFILNNTEEWLALHKFNMALSEEGYNLYNAVYAVAYTYHELVLQQVDSQQMEKPKGIFNDCQEVASLLKTRVFTNPVGELVNMNHRENQCAEYDIFNIWNFPQGLGIKVKIGSYFPCLSQSQQLHISEDLEWSTGGTSVPTSMCSETCTAGFRKTHQQQTADCCFDCAHCAENEVSNETADMEQCVRCPDDKYANVQQTHCLQRAISFLAYEDPLGMALGCMALCFSALTVLVLFTFVKYKDTPIVKANNCILSYILLIFLIMCFLCSLLFIGHPNQATCLLQQTTFGIFFTGAISTVLAKTITVVMAFKLTTPGRRMRGMLVTGAPRLVILICTLIQLVFCGIWLVISPPFIDRDIQSEHGKTIIICNKGSVIAFHFVLGYLGSLALGSFTVAFLARNLPDRFNEAKFLTFSMLVFCSVWITFLPVYHSTRGKIMVVVEVFSILASSAGLLGCIFVPKCYVILVRPDSNFLQKYKAKFRY
ncbi:vomeronasal type-2 receptor 116-like isoform X2 [Grammomys surdaster]|uniref:vomeronasal type-2 receptor 116-like isoform X2 n=1 Tax=Grammomys surdaster TaxID=491861 RepID=UPI00109FF542|nr:vomeronasal type-2 receptor 116-like isoform X2 [Grammomys surdaster]